MFACRAFFGTRIPHMHIPFERSVQLDRFFSIYFLAALAISLFLAALVGHLSSGASKTPEKPGDARPFRELKLLTNDAMSPLFLAAIEATEERAAGLGSANAPASAAACFEVATGRLSRPDARRKGEPGWRSNVRLPSLLRWVRIRLTS